MRTKRITERDLNRIISRVLREEDETLDFTALDDLSSIKGVASITECKKDNFEPAMCLSKSMDVIPFNIFVKEFFPKYQEIAKMTGREVEDIENIDTEEMDDFMTENRRRYRRY